MTDRPTRIQVTPEQLDRVPVADSAEDMPRRPGRPILLLHQRAGEPLPICQWWAGCERVAQLAVAHPILEWVATCRDCARRVRTADQ